MSVEEAWHAGLTHGFELLKLAGHGLHPDQVFAAAKEQLELIHQQIRSDRVSELGVYVLAFLAVVSLGVRVEQDEQLPQPEEVATALKFTKCLLNKVYTEKLEP